MRAAPRPSTRRRDSWSRSRARSSFLRAFEISASPPESVARRSIARSTIIVTRRTRAPATQHPSARSGTPRTERTEKRKKKSAPQRTQWTQRRNDRDRRSQRETILQSGTRPGAPASSSASGLDGDGDGDGEKNRVRARARVRTGTRTRTGTATGTIAVGDLLLLHCVARGESFISLRP